MKDGQAHRSSKLFARPDLLLLDGDGGVQLPRARTEPFPLSDPNGSEEKEPGPAQVFVGIGGRNPIEAMDAVVEDSFDMPSNPDIPAFRERNTDTGIRLRLSSPGLVRPSRGDTRTDPRGDLRGDLRGSDFRGEGRPDRTDVGRVRQSSMYNSSAFYPETSGNDLRRMRGQEEDGEMDGLSDVTPSIPEMPSSLFDDPEPTPLSEPVRPLEPGRLRGSKKPEPPPAAATDQPAYRWQVASVVLGAISCISTGIIIGIAVILWKPQLVASALTNHPDMLARLGLQAAPPAAVEPAAATPPVEPPATTPPPSGRTKSDPTRSPTTSPAVATPTATSPATATGAAGASERRVSEGMIQINTDTSATIYIDGARWGQVQDTAQIRLEAGSHTIRAVTSRGSSTKQIRVDEGQARVVSFSFR